MPSRRQTTTETIEPTRLTNGVAPTPFAFFDVDSPDRGERSLAISGPPPQGRTVRPSMPRSRTARGSLRDQLHHAVLHEEWELHFQPLVDLSNDALGGLEALLRWRHPDRGLLAPAGFVVALERLAIAAEVGRWVVNEACRQLAAWRASGLRVPRVGVNLFAAHLRAGSLEADVRSALDRHRLSPSDLEIEVTETIALDDDDRASRSLSALREVGVGIALDDFGTGYASLRTLKRYPVTRLKIDRSFVEDLRESRTSQALVGAMLDIGRNLCIEIVAEGIETAAQREALDELGCRWGQGYLFSRPVPPAEIRFWAWPAS